MQLHHSSADANLQLEWRARVALVGAVGDVEQLTYAVPRSMADKLQPGHRVIVPMRSRRVTGIVLEVGVNLDSGDAVPRPIAELLEMRPLFDRAHLQLIEFLATYYMVSLSEAYRSVIPATARVESRRLFAIGANPHPLVLAALSPIEKRILDALRKRPMTAAQLSRLDDQRVIADGLRHLEAEGLIAQREGTRGRHRETRMLIARLVGKLDQVARGPKQLEILRMLSESNGEDVTLDRLEAEIGGAKAATRALVKRGLVELSDLAAGNDQNEPISDAPFPLTSEQSAAIDAIAPAVRDRRFETFLLWGVTAGGKTEIYVRLAAEALASGRQVLVLVPEIALADQVVRTFRARFGPTAAVVHSAQNVAERWSGWMASLKGATRVMIGPRSAIFAPMHDLGLIVVDEEHDGAYKQEEGIRYNARDLAVALGRFSGCPVVLGSATPSAESYANARRGRYRLLRITERIRGRRLAAVEVLDLRQQLPKQSVEKEPTGNQNAPIPFAPALITALRENLAAGGQSVIFLNRRGYHNFLQCHLCGNVIACPNCSVSMTFHLRDRSVRCHYCGHTSNAPEKCPECEGYGLEGQGFGTERLAEKIAELMPQARIERMDSDTSGRRGARSAIIAGVKRGAIDILVGTQMITKGFDFPNVTLVGVVLADASLNVPDFRSAERTFQLLTQVAGRAGRGDKPGRVLIQTYAPHHYSIRAARDQDYARFIRRELELRRELGYPPFARMALVRVEGSGAPAVTDLAHRVATFLSRFAQPDAIRVLGPAPAPIERIRKRYRWQVVIKSPRLDEMRQALASMRAQLGPGATRNEVRLAIDIDPINMM